MLNDRELEQATAQLQDFRTQHDTYQKTQGRLLLQYSSLIEDYKRLKSDYEEERDSRERYKQLAKGQERNPFVLVLIDGDGYVFDDDLISSGGDGGTRAGHLLNDAIKVSLRSRNLDHCKIVVRIYANLSGLSKALSKNKLCGPEKRSLSPFVASFNRSSEMFDFVDAGEFKESAEFKIRAVFRQFVENTQCKHIFFAACHDIGYISELTPHVSKRDQITLVRSSASHPDFTRLGLRTEDFPYIFRSSPIPNSDAVPMLKANPTPPATSHPSSTPSVELSNICSFYQKGLCKYGKSCKFLHVKTTSNGHTAPNFSDIKDWRKDASPNKPSMSFQMALLNRADNDYLSETTGTTGSKEFAQAQADFMTLPREEDIPENQIPLNEHNQRLDAYLPPPSNEDRAHFHARVTQQKLCNNLHLLGNCSQGPACQYDHSEITEGMRNCLKQVAHNNPCPRRGACRSLTCPYGHVCQKADCKYRGGRQFCKFPPQAHFVDLNVLEYVTGTNKETGYTEHVLPEEDGFDSYEKEKPLIDVNEASSPVSISPPPSISEGDDSHTDSPFEAHVYQPSHETSQDASLETSDAAAWWQQ